MFQSDYFNLKELTSDNDVVFEPEGKILVAKFEFDGSFGKLEGDCHKLEVTLNLELLVTFGMSFGGVSRELYTYVHYKLIPSNLEVTKIP